MEKHQQNGRERILRLREVLERTGLSRSTLYEKIGDKAFPASVRLGARIVGWVESEVDDWIASCIKMSRPR